VHDAVEVISHTLRYFGVVVGLEVVNTSSVYLINVNPDVIISIWTRLFMY